MNYTPTSLVGGPGFFAWVYRELQRIALALSAPEFDTVQLVERHAEPEKLGDGLLAFADGTDWNPGAGRGIYVYAGGTWSKL